MGGHFMSRPTPRTDAALKSKGVFASIQRGESWSYVEPSFARDLERKADELAEALERIAHADYEDAFHAIEHCQQIAQETLAQWKEKP